jgi:hypothetical protein
MDDGHSAAMEQQASPANDDDDVNDDATKHLHVKASLGGVVGESAQPDNGNDDGDAVGDISDDDDAVGSVSSSDNDDDDDTSGKKPSAAAAAAADAGTDAVAKVRQDPKNRTVKGAFESDDEDAGAAAGDASQVCAWPFQLSSLLLSCCTHSQSSAALFFCSSSQCHTSAADSAALSACSSYLLSLPVIFHPQPSAFVAHRLFSCPLAASAHSRSSRRRFRRTSSFTKTCPCE